MFHKTQPYEQNTERFVQEQSHKYFYLKYLIILLSVTSVKTNNFIPKSSFISELWKACLKENEKMNRSKQVKVYPPGHSVRAVSSETAFGSFGGKSSSFLAGILIKFALT